MGGKFFYINRKYLFSCLLAAFFPYHYIFFFILFCVRTFLINSVTIYLRNLDEVFGRDHL